MEEVSFVLTGIAWPGGNLEQPIFFFFSFFFPGQSEQKGKLLTNF
jgi:hypothetical protein